MLYLRFKQRDPLVLIEAWMVQAIIKAQQLVVRQKSNLVCAGLADMLIVRVWPDEILNNTHMVSPPAACSGGPKCASCELLSS